MSQPCIIRGSIMPTESLHSWIDKRQTTLTPTDDNHQQPSVKRQKIQTQSIQLTTMGQIVFPFFCTTSLIMDTLNNETLYSHWTFGSDTEPFATLKVLTKNDHQLVLEKQVAKTDDTIENNEQLFLNMAHLHTRDIIAILNITLSSMDDNDRNSMPQNTDNYKATLTFGANIDLRRVRVHLFNSIFPFLYPTKNNERSFDGSIPIDDFYRHLQPPISETVLEKCHAQGLKPKLTPFQSQNVEWMVNREGLLIREDGTLQEKITRSDQMPYLWEQINITATGQQQQHLYINHVSQRILTSWNEELEWEQQKIYRGGILSDEMGLGKTVSTIALILLNSTKNSGIFNSINASGLKKTTATLIITPGTIIHQWESEFKRHAPELRTTLYSGIKSIPQDMEMDEYADVLASNDIVLTTYEVLRTEVYFARNIPDRPRRHETTHKAKRSPLVHLLWWRCVLDEAQEVESPVSRTAEMARLIPRFYSWGVTGTPLKSSNYDDLYGLFIFLDQFTDVKKSQLSNMYSSLQPLFMAYTKQIMRRNMKCFLQNQIHIPKQHRHVIKISFSTIEQHYYNDLHALCRQEADPDWLNSIGWIKPSNTSNPVYAKYVDSTRKLRRWLTTLRETCVYPAFLGKTNEIVQSLDQVLEVMIQGAKEKIDEAQITLANHKLAHGGMHELMVARQHEETQEPLETRESWKTPLLVYLDWLPSVEDQVKIHASKLKQARDANHLNKQQHDSGDNDFMDSNNDTKTQDNKAIMALLAAHNTWQNIVHRFYFYIAGVYHMLEDKEKEAEYYDKAAEMRRQILARPLEKVHAFVEDVNKMPNPLMPGKMLVSFSPQKETLLLTDHLMSRVDDLTEKMNQQMEVVADWRTMLQQFLASELVDSNGEDIQGDEYDNSLIIQEKCDLYQDMYQDILRDRNYLVNGIWKAPRVSNSQEEYQLNNAQNEEIMHLREELVQLRQKLAPNDLSSDNLRQLLTEFREVASGQHATHKVEQHLIQQELTRLARELKQQKDLQEALESEYRKLSGLANHRIEFYRALQQISDHVKKWECQYPHAEIDELQFKMSVIEDKLSEQSSRQRYLENIAKEKQEQKKGDADDQELFCLICKEYFTTGIVTYCGHLYCDVCANAWFRTSRRCPQCSSIVKRNEWYSISWLAATLQQDEKTPLTENIPSGGLTSNTLQEIGRVDIEGGLGAKLDNVIKHIKYIQQTNNGKCLVFSQWNRLLELMSKGLTMNGLGHVNLTTGKKDNNIERFRSDPSINVMLLHARSHSSGLTLLEAKTVFIIEPVLNDSLEKQAIGRVHRIGQTEETSVFWYIVRDTIEERIHAIHTANQRHRQIAGMDLASTAKPSLTSKSEGGGEYVTDDDLRKCFIQEPLDRL